MGAEIHLQPAEDAKPEKVMFKENCMYEYPLNQAPGRIYGLMEREAHPEAGFKAGLVTPGGGPYKTTLCLRDVSLGGTNTAEVCGKL